jgi:hypothetical protein
LHFLVHLLARTIPVQPGQEDKMSELKGVTDDIVGTARDAAYVAVGLGVLAFQRAQVRREELLKALSGSRGEIEGRLADVRDEIGKRVKFIDERFEQVLETIEASMIPLEDRLPEPAKDIVRQARTQAHEVRQQIRSFLATAA